MSYPVRPMPRSCPRAFNRLMATLRPSEGSYHGCAGKTTVPPGPKQNTSGLLDTALLDRAPRGGGPGSGFGRAESGGFAQVLKQSRRGLAQQITGGVVGSRHRVVLMLAR